MNFPLLTVKSHFLARINKRFILTGDVGRLFTIIIIVSVIVIFIVIVIVNVIVIDNDVVIAVIVIDIVIVHKCIDRLDQYSRCGLNELESRVDCKKSNSRFFFSKSVKKSVKRGVESYAREAREPHTPASLPSLDLCFQPCSRPFV